MSNSVSGVPPLPEIFVGKDIISQRVNNYLQSKHPVLSQALSQGGQARQETKSIWYSKKHVQTWLEEMEIMDADGIRCYLGAYGEEDSYPGQLCLLIVLTRAGNTPNTHKNIILEDEPGFSDRQVNSQVGIARNFFFSDENRKREYNYGSPCPPACDSDPTF